MAKTDFEKKWIIMGSPAPTKGSGVAAGQELTIGSGSMSHSADWNGTGWTYQSSPESLAGSINLGANRTFTITKNGSAIECTVDSVEVPERLRPYVQTLPAESWTAREG